MTTEQEQLTEAQNQAFRHSLFVEGQVRDFVALVGIEGCAGKVVVDIGGGCGFFAKHLAEVAGYKVRVIDRDQTCVSAAMQAGIDAVCGDALTPPIAGDEGIVCFNMVLHHLVGTTEEATVELQRRALTAWRPQVGAIFVQEYVYESFLWNLSGRLIFEITKSTILSLVGRAVAALIPSLKANTFGVGVRFRSHAEWVRLFESSGYTVKASVIGEPGKVSLPRRLLLIKSIRRDSFILEPQIKLPLLASPAERTRLCECERKRR